MSRYILKRILLMIPIVVIVTMLIYCILNTNTDSILYSIAGLDAKAEVIEQLKVEMGFDKPVVVRYFKYLYNVVVHQDFGTSYIGNRPVFDDIMGKLPVSIRVSFNAMLVSTLIGIPVGIISAVKQYSILDRVCLVVSTFISAVPAFWLSMMLILGFAVKLRMFPTSGIDSWVGYVLPAFGLGLPYAASQMRYTRTAVLETIRSEYVDTARSKGVPEQKVIMKHALKNAMLPVITVVGTTFGALIGGSVVTETLFALPGIGSYMMAGINSRDVPIVCGTIIVQATIFSVVVLATDLLHAAIDPRIKARYAKKKG